MGVDEEADPFGLSALPDDAMPAAPNAAPAQLPPLPPPDEQLAEAGHAPAGPDLTIEAHGAVPHVGVPPRPEAGQAAERGSRAGARERPDREGLSNREADAAEPRSRRDEHHKDRHRDGRSDRESRRDRDGDSSRREHKPSGKAHKSDRHGKDRKRERSNSGDEGRGKRDRPR